MNLRQYHDLSVSVVIIVVIVLVQVRANYVDISSSVVS